VLHATGLWYTFTGLCYTLTGLDYTLSGWAGEVDAVSANHYAQPPECGGVTVNFATPISPNALVSRHANGIEESFDFPAAARRLFVREDVPCDRLTDRMSDPDGRQRGPPKRKIMEQKRFTDFAERHPPKRLTSPCRSAAALGGYFVDRLHDVSEGPHGDMSCRNFDFDECCRQIAKQCPRHCVTVDVPPAGHERSDFVGRDEHIDTTTLVAVNPKGAVPNRFDQVRVCLAESTVHTHRAPRGIVLARGGPPGAPHRCK